MDFAWLSSTLSTWLTAHPHIADWIFDWPKELSGAIIGAIVGALFDFRNNVPKIISKVKFDIRKKVDLSKKSHTWIFNLFSPNSKIDSASFSPRVSGKEDALKDPGGEKALPIQGLQPKQNFICEKIKEIYSKNGKIFDKQQDYIDAENYKAAGHSRLAANCYIRVLNPLISLLVQMNLPNVAVALQQEIDFLRIWNKDGLHSEEVDSIIIRIEAIIFDFTAEL